MDATLEKLPAPTVSETLEWGWSYEAPSDWDAFVDSSTRCVFHKSSWIKTLEAGYHTRCLYFYARRGGKITAGLAAMLFDFKFFRLLFSAMPYGGIIGRLADEDAEGFVAFFEKAARKLGVHQIRLTRIALYEYPDLKSFGYGVKEAHQHELDLSGHTPESLWTSYRKNTRRDVNKARKSGIAVREMTGRAELQDYFRLYQKTMNRNAGVSPYSMALYQAIYENMIATGRGTILFAEMEGKIIGGLLLIFSEERAWLLGAVSDTDYLKYCPNDLLYQTAIEKIFESKRRYFDLMMSQLEDQALIWFKEKWGSRRFPFLFYSKDLSVWHCRIWDFVWKLANTRIGSAAARLVRRQQ